MHTSGIGHPVDYGWGTPEFDDESLERHVRGLRSHKLVEIEPGSTSYSDIAFNVLGDLIAKVSGTSYEQYMKQHIFDPLGMTTTTLMAPRATHAGLVATGYEQTEDGSIVESRYPYNRMHVPCGCIASSAAEMARWMLVNLQRGEVDGVRILPASTYDEMWRILDCRTREVQFRRDGKYVGCSVRRDQLVRAARSFSPKPSVDSFSAHAVAGCKRGQGLRRAGFPSLSDRVRDGSLRC
jgi:CubicO group peptidase (beta-lactamase class C family)